MTVCTTPPHHEVPAAEGGVGAAVGGCVLPAANAAKSASSVSACAITSSFVPALGRPATATVPNLSAVVAGSVADDITSPATPLVVSANGVLTLPPHCAVLPEVQDAPPSQPTEIVMPSG